MAKKILDDASFFDDEGDIIDRVAREHEILERQKAGDIDLLRLNLDELESLDVKSDKPITDINLNTIIEYYHKCLSNNKKAQEFLTNKGLCNLEHYLTFKIGFADGSLINIIGNTQKKELIDIGVLKDNKNEYLKDCITITIIDDKQVIGIHGINIYDDLPVKSIYVNEERKGLFNIRASKVYDEIILTNSILDGLSLIEPGIENVIAVEGTGNLCADHITRLRDNRVKTVVFAFSNDAVSRGGAGIITDLFVTEGFKVKLIFPPNPHKDWNECLLSGVESKKIKDLIDNAEIFETQEVKKAFQVKKEGFKHIFEVGEITYTVTGVKEIFISNLRINIKAEYEGERFPDNVDLYSSRSRASFSLTLSQRFGIEPKRIEKDLIMMLEYFEDKRDKKLDSTEEDKKKEMTEEEKKIGMDFLKSPDIFNQIIKDIEILGHVGEKNNKIISYLIAVSRFSAKPLSLFIQSGPSSGKSYLLETILKLLPPEAFKWISSISDQAFHYMPDDDFLNKIFMMGEALHNEIVEGYIRQMQSENKITRHVTMKDPKTGEMKTIEKDHIVNLVFMMTSTAMKVNLENLSRCIVTHADESADQTKKVLSMQRHKESFEGYLEGKHIVPQIIKKHIAAQRMLSSVTVFNPFKKYINFPSIRSIMRRGQQQFLGLINSSAILRQMQKKQLERIDHYTGQKVTGYYCDLFDYGIARKLFVEEKLLQHDDDVSAGAIKLYEAIRKMVKAKAEKERLKPEDLTVIQADVRGLTDLSASSVKQYLRILVEYEYLQVIGGKKHGTRFCYRLREDKAVKEVDISKIIPTVEEIKRMIENDKEFEIDLAYIIVDYPEF